MTRAIHWFRNDLRLQDNTAIDALSGVADEWLPVFVFDPQMLSGPRTSEPRIQFLLDCLRRLSRELEKRGVPLILRKGHPSLELPKLLHESGARILSFNQDVTPLARRRDGALRLAVEREGVRVIDRLDHVVYRSSEVRSATGGAYSVYSPYRKAWWKRWSQDPRMPVRTGRLPRSIPGYSADPIPSACELGVRTTECVIPTGGADAARRRLRHFLNSAAGRYHEDRDRPDLDGTSRLSPYLRFGAISVRQCFGQAEEAAIAEPAFRQGIEKWLDELIWREFYSAILEEHPRVLRENYNRKTDAVVWNEDPEGFESWCEGRTGYPIVDAGMRQLLSTGWMHNRVRMIVASFLTKDLLIDWRQGERFFFEHLVDGDPASNNGGWQWAASTGTDAQPYFRIFNPALQGKRWDPQGRYVRRWIPELRDMGDSQIHEPWKSRLPDGYPPPVVDHTERRGIALERFRSARAGELNS